MKTTTTIFANVRERRARPGRRTGWPRFLRPQRPRPPSVGPAFAPPAPRIRGASAGGRPTLEASASGFTLIELLVVISIIAMLVAILVPALGRAKELANRTRCGTNLHAISQGIAIYTNANGDQWPWVQASASWSAGTGQNRFTAPSATTNYCVSTLLFLLVRDGQAPGLFVCPSTSDTPDPNTKNGNSYAWDFSPSSVGGQEHLSYSYQQPRYDANGASCSNGVTASSDAGLVVLADRTPAYAGGAGGISGRRADFPWDNLAGADPRAGMSANHSDGEYTNLLYADLHVGYANRADVSISNDNIYTASGASDTRQGGGSLLLTDHKSTRDSMLGGPVKY